MNFTADHPYPPQTLSKHPHQLPRRTLCDSPTYYASLLLTSSYFNQELISRTIWDFDRQLISKTTISRIYNSKKTMVEPLVSLILQRFCSSSRMAAAFRVSSDGLQTRVSDPPWFMVSSDGCNNKVGSWMVAVSPTS